MKKNLIFLLLFLFFGCQSTFDKPQKIALIKCPKIFFSSENSVYVNGDIVNLDIDKIKYRAKLNNYNFSQGCFSDLNKNNYPIDLLILLEPTNLIDQEISLSLFTLLYDSNDKLIDRYYFIRNRNINMLEENLDLNTKDIIVNLNISVDKSEKVEKITIGFVKI